jgi:uncharacterized membrane-anchored protein YjiN (DUF445 family)
VERTLSGPAPEPARAPVRLALPLDGGNGSEEDKLRGLRRMKRLATALLVLAAVVFVAIRVTDPGGAWAGYVEATAEAAMVGALADWFAVTALFRHPLGIPVPHTAIIPTRKDQIGASLGEFVESNFLEPHLLGERLADAHLARRVGDWSSEAANARLVGEQFAAAVRGVTEILDDDLVQQGIEQVAVQRLESVPVAPLAGRALEFLLEGGHHHQLFDSALIGLGGFLDDNRDVFRARLNTESPWWVPESVDDKVFDKIYTAVDRFIADVGGDPGHPLRLDLDDRLRELAHRLRTSPELLARGESLKAQVLDQAEVRSWLSTLWASIKAELIKAAESPDSELRRRLEQTVTAAGERLQTDVELQARVDQWIVSSVAYLGNQFRGEASELIASTVQRWDPDDTSRRIEVHVGRDLQFIRINGTLVGGLAGLVIHAVSQLLL